MLKNYGYQLRRKSVYFIRKYLRKKKIRNKPIKCNHIEKIFHVLNVLKKKLKKY